MTDSIIVLYAAIVCSVIAAVYGITLYSKLPTTPYRHLILFLVLCVAVGVGIMFLSCDFSPPPSAFQCPGDDPAQHGSHNVTFVVVTVGGTPVPDMLVECNGSSIRHAVTQADGSCEFVLDGETLYSITVYNKTLDAQKDFDLYPVHSCYPLIIP